MLSSDSRLARLIAAAKSHRKALRLAGSGIGLLLLIGACLLILRERETLHAALDALRAPNAGLFALLIGAIIGNFLLSGLMFSVLIRPFGRVGLIEMQAVVAAASLINFLPLRPGLFGRIAYHSVVNKIPVRDATRVMIEGMVMTITAALLMAVMVGLSRWTGTPTWTLAVIPPFLLAALSAVDPARRRPLLALLLRYVDLALWAVRYLAAFALLGRDLGLDAAFALATVSVLATMVPFFSNGLGLREWAVGLVAPLITSYQLELALTAEIINRAVEVLLVLVLGLTALGWLTWRRSAWPHSPPESRDEGPGRRKEVSRTADD